MAEVVLQREKPEQEEYEYIEPPRATVAAPSKSSHADPASNLNPSSPDYPRFTSAEPYAYVEPPRVTVAPQNEVQTDNSVSIPVSQIPVSVLSDQTNLNNAGYSIEDSTALNFKARIKAKKIPEELNIHSFILMLVGSQNVFLLGSLIFVDLAVSLGFTFVIDFFIYLWWAPYAAIGVYACLYLALWRFQQRISISASCFFLIQIAIVCESIFLIYLNLSLGIDLGYLFCASFQMISCVYTAALVAQCMKKSYTGIVGRLIAMGPSLVCLALYVAFAEGAWKTTAYVIISFFVSLYVWFLITKIDEFVEVSGGRDTILSGIYCSLLVIKKKIEWVLRIVVFPYTIYLIVQGEQKKKNPDIIEPLLDPTPTK